MQLERMKGESAAEHHRRLVYGKMVDKTLADVDYAELSQEVYGQNYSSDTVRKMMYGSRLTLDMLSDTSPNGKDASDDSGRRLSLDDKIREFQEERKKLQTEKIEYSKMLRENARDNLIFEKLRDAIAALEPLSVGDTFVISDSVGARREGVLAFGDEPTITQENGFWYRGTADAMYQNWASDPKVTRFLTWPPHPNADVTRKVIESWLPLYENPSYYHWTITLKEDDKVIGEIFAHPEGNDPEDKEMDTFSPCWMLNLNYTGKGYAYEAAHAYFDYLFREKGARRIYAYTEDYNLPSQRLCEKLGMRREGLFMEFVSFINNPDGIPRYENTMEYAILKKEWR